jgi:hypothetical protein
MNIVICVSGKLKIVKIRRIFTHLKLNANDVSSSPVYTLIIFFGKVTPPGVTKPRFALMSDGGVAAITDVAQALDDILLGKTVQASRRTRDLVFISPYPSPCLTNGRV